jgi:cytochrome b pre-mRNA-processing protein 3
LHVSFGRSKTVIFQWLFGRKRSDPSDAVYGAIVAAARQPKFYAEWGVPDTLDGRFDLLVLHVYLVLDRLRSFGTEADELRQALTDRFFAEMDAALREVGVGDLTVGKKVRKMAEAFFGRSTAYTAAMAKGELELSEAFARNVYAETDATHAPALAKWSLQARGILAKLNYDDIASGRVRFE